MKKFAITLDKAFAFDKETIAKLSDAQMSALAGGKGAAQNDAIVPDSCGWKSCNKTVVPTEEG